MCVRNVIGIPKCLSALSVCYGDIVCRCCQFVVRYGDIFPPTVILLSRKEAVVFVPKDKVFGGIRPYASEEIGASNQSLKVGHWSRSF